MKEIRADELKEFIKISTSVYICNDRIEEFRKSLLKTINFFKKEQYDLEDICKPLSELVDKKELDVGWNILRKEKIIIVGNDLKNTYMNSNHPIKNSPDAIKRFFEME